MYIWIVKDKIITVQKEHINRGVEKYKGVKDDHLESLLRNANMPCTPYIFNDGRVLLKYDLLDTALLYPSLDYLFDILALDER